MVTVAVLDVPIELEVGKLPPTVVMPAFSEPTDCELPSVKTTEVPTADVLVLMTVKGPAPRLGVGASGPPAGGEIDSAPPVTVVPPVYVLALSKTVVPVPVLTMAVRMPPLVLPS